MNVWLWKEATFDAAHQLPLHDGACKRLHGHTYKLQLGLYVPVDSTTGMGLDFKHLSRFISEEVLYEYDHQLLNDRLRGLQPTAENIAGAICRKAKTHFRCPVKVRIWETPTSWCEISDEDA